MDSSRKRAILLALAALYISAWLLPPLLMSSGFDGLTPDQQEVADNARALAWSSSWEKWFERLWITHVKAEVLSVGAPQESPGHFSSGWVVRVTAYSLFGIPYGQLIFTNGDRLRENVGFPRNASGPLGLLAVAVCTLAAFILWPREGLYAADR